MCLLAEIYCTSEAGFVFGLKLYTVQNLNTHIFIDIILSLSKHEKSHCELIVHTYNMSLYAFMCTCRNYYHFRTIYLNMNVLCSTLIERLWLIDFSVTELCNTISGHTSMLIEGRPLLIYFKSILELILSIVHIDTKIKTSSWLRYAHILSVNELTRDKTNTYCVKKKKS